MEQLANKVNTGKKKPHFGGGLKLAAFFIVVVLLAIALLQAGYVSSNAAAECKTPQYEKQDISGVLEKERLSESDYEFLYEQTGLTKIGVDRALSRGEQGKKLIKSVQDRLFTPHEVERRHVASWMCIDLIDENVPNVYLEAGDVVVTSSTHISSCRIGHAGLVVDGENGRVLQATCYGENTRVGSIDNFTTRVNFMILRPKASAEIRQKAADYAMQNLVGIPYSAFAGVITNKYDIPKTQCAHVVWYAYNRLGFNLVNENKSMILPFDLANSDNLEVVQVFGFDLEKKWDKLVY